MGTTQESWMMAFGMVDAKSVINTQSAIVEREKAKSPGANLAKKKKRKVETKREKIFKLYENGASVEEIESVFVSKHGYVRYVLSESGMIEKRPVGIQRRRAVVQMSIDGKIMREYESIVVASSSTGIDVEGIRRACVGIFSQSGGFKWCFKNNKTEGLS